MISVTLPKICGNLTLSWYFSFLIFQLGDSGRMGELGHKFWRFRYRNFDEPGVRSTRTPYGILENIVHGILEGVHVCFTDPTDRRACMFHRTSWEYHYNRCRHFDDLDRWINVRVHLDVVRNSGIVHGILDGVHVCFMNPIDSTSPTGAASRLLN